MDLEVLEIPAGRLFCHGLALRAGNLDCGSLTSSAPTAPDNPGSCSGSAAGRGSGSSYFGPDPEGSKAVRIRVAEVWSGTSRTESQPGPRPLVRSF